MALQPHERIQLRFWQCVLDRELHGTAVVFELRNAWRVPVTRLNQHSGRHFRGLTCVLEDGQGASLLGAHAVPWALQDGMAPEATSGITHVKHTISGRGGGVVAK
eukprot:11023160-Alexandrium_andersonii.AAC.1